jgi:hypothetical protein
VGQTKNTAFAEEANRGRDTAYESATVQLGAASGTFNVAAPFAGKVSRIEVQTQTTTDGSNKIALAITNESNSAAAIASETFDDDPVLTTNVVGVLTLSTTAANLLIDQGDNIEVAYTETGTIAGGMVTIYFENF